MQGDSPKAKVPSVGSKRRGSDAYPFRSRIALVAAWMAIWLGTGLVISGFVLAFVAILHEIPLPSWWAGHATHGVVLAASTFLLWCLTGLVVVVPLFALGNLIASVGAQVIDPSHRRRLPAVLRPPSVGVEPDRLLDTPDVRHRRREERTAEMAELMARVQGEERVRQRTAEATASELVRRRGAEAAAHVLDELEGADDKVLEPPSRISMNLSDDAADFLSSAYLSGRCRRPLIVALQAQLSPIRRPGTS